MIPKKLTCFKDILKKNKMQIGKTKGIPLYSISELYGSLESQLDKKLESHKNELLKWAEKMKNMPNTPEFEPLKNQISTGFNAAQKIVIEFEANLSFLISTGRGLPKVNL